MLPCDCPFIKNTIFDFMSLFHCIWVEGHSHSIFIDDVPIATSDVPGRGLGWASAGSGLQILKPDLEPAVGLGLGLVGLVGRVIAMIIR